MKNSHVHPGNPDAEKCSVLRKPVRQHFPLFLIYCIFNGILAASAIASVQLRSRLVDGMLDRVPERLIVLLLLGNLFLLFLSRYALPLAIRLSGDRLEERISISVEETVQRKKNEIPFPCHEDAQIRDKIALSEEAPRQVWAYWQSLVKSISVCAGALAMFLLLARLGTLLTAGLFVLFLPIVLYSLKAGTSYYDTWERTAQLRRHCDDQREVLLGREYAQERLLFGYAPFFQKRWETEYGTIRKLSIQEELRGARKMQVSGILFCAYILILVFVIVQKLLAGQVSAGYAVAVVSVLPFLFSDMISVVSNEINTVARASASARAVQFLLNMEGERGAWDLPREATSFSQIEFVDVSFRYPQTERWVLRHLSMKFQRGKHYALVGENGAGKSTVIKLLLRLYRVTEGAILVDGRDINDLEKSELTGLVTALFQDFQRYYTSVAENIGVGDIRCANHRERIVGSAELSGVAGRIASLPDGYDTVLGTMNEGGVELSGGEWQRLCIARLVMSPCPVKILDEPTAAMDPVFEYELYRDFETILADRTTITISHRLASCKSADWIYVIGCGGIAEQGDHECLMAQRGRYWEMYTTQSSMYQ